MEQCDFCQRGKPLVIGKTDDYGISINNKFFGEMKYGGTKDEETDE